LPARPSCKFCAARKSSCRKICVQKCQSWGWKLAPFWRNFGANWNVKPQLVRSLPLFVGKSQYSSPSTCLTHDAAAHYTTVHHGTAEWHLAELWRPTCLHGRRHLGSAECSQLGPTGSAPIRLRLSTTWHKLRTQEAHSSDWNAQLQRRLGGGVKNELEAGSCIFTTDVAGNNFWQSSLWVLISKSTICPIISPKFEIFSRTFCIFPHAKIQKKCGNCFVFLYTTTPLTLFPTFSKAAHSLRRPLRHFLAYSSFYYHADRVLGYVIVTCSQRAMYKLLTYLPTAEWHGNPVEIDPLQRHYYHHLPKAQCYIKYKCTH